MTLFLGENIKIGDGYTRSFVFKDNVCFELRSNSTYDEAVELLKVTRK